MKRRQASRRSCSRGGPYKVAASRAAIVGIGESRVGRLRGMSALRLTLEAARAALQDAGVPARAIDGVLTRNLDMDVTYMHSQLIAKHLGMQPRFTTDINLGGATAIAMLEQAGLLVSSGVCQFVLCAYGENRRTSWATERHGRLRMGNEDFEECFGLTWGMGPHALAAQRHMYEFGTSSHQLGMIAVAQRCYAQLHPNADLRTPLSLEEYRRSPWVIAPLRKYDLAYLFDGGAAVIVASAAWAQDHIARPVVLLGLGQAHSGHHIAYCADLVVSTTTPAVQSGTQAFRAAGLSPRDVDVALLYDDTTYGVLVQLEDYGFCPKGEGGRFVEDGHLGPTGSLPVNTHGGNLSQAHLDGMCHVLEAVRQLRQEAGPRQVPQASIALVSGFGGAFATSTTALLGRVTLAAR
jgi:acetyl-CoA acetyltransferase